MNIELNDLITIFSILITIIALTISMLTAKLSKNAASKYNEELKRIEYDKFREYYEKKLLELNEEVSSNAEKWKDINHLIISGNKNIINENISSDPFGNNSFLIKNGLNKENIEIDKKEVFVLTSFMEEHRETYSIIKNTCNELGLNCSKSDENFIEGDILRHILKKIVQSRIIIANVDGRNPNVFYELGIAHALGKPTIIVAKNKNKIPFDLTTKNIIFYQNKEELQKGLLIEINKYLLNS